MVGETAFAIGSPLDLVLSNTVTKRYCFSSKSSNSDVDGDGTVDLNQNSNSNRWINPGNSGGSAN